MSKANKRPIPVLAFEEAAKFFAAKVPLTRPEFDALVAEVKRRAFTVARVQEMEFLVDMKKAVQGAIDDGSTLAEFNAAFETLVNEKGWSGTTPWHAETIFRTNVQSAYGAGRYEQHAAAADLYPFAEYSAIDDDRTRDEHKELDGTIAPIDSAFWMIHYPPWDYNCRCSAIPLSEDEVGNREITTDYGPAPENDFTSPAVGADYIPDLSRFTPEEADQVRQALKDLPEE